MGRLTTHVLDTATGRPALGIDITLHRLDPSGPQRVMSTRTNLDGRCDAPLLEGAAMHVGIYELTFDAASYFDASGLDLPEPKFLDQVVIRFGISAPDQHYHVPLLLSPYGYSTYRGS